MLLAHRDYYQVSILDSQMADREGQTSARSRMDAIPFGQFNRLLARRVDSLETLLDSCHLITPLLNALQGVVFFIKDAEARYVLANLTLARRCGHDTVASLLGQTSSDVFPERLGSIYVRQDHHVLSTGIALADQLELHLFYEGETGWCLTHKLPIYDMDGNIVGVAGISHDLPTGDASHPAYARIAVVYDHIVRHFDRNIALAELTQLAGLSASQLERYCKRIYQLTPRQIVHKTRIEYASQLLAENRLSITEISMQCGYSDHSAFSRQFKSITGFAPQQFRRAVTS